jgi:hypothetical protein
LAESDNVEIFLMPLPRGVKQFCRGSFGSVRLATASFFLGSIIMPMRPVKMLSESQMCLSRLRAQAANGLHRCFRQLKAGFGVIETEEVNPVMRSSQQIIGNHE